MGRYRELAEVCDVLEWGLRGAAGAVCIEGVAGMGRTTVLQAAVGRATALGYVVLAAQASAAESELPFGVVRQLFEQVPAADREELLSGSAQLAAWVLEGQHCPDDEAAVLHALHRLAARLAARAPLLLAVDDLDHADPPSLRWLAYLRRRMRRMPVVLATTVGIGGRPTDRALLIDVVAAARRLTLSPLDADSCAELVRAAMAPQPVAAEFAQACRVASDGNPFLLGELLRAIRAEGVRPDSHAVDRVRRCRPPWLAGWLLIRLRAQDPALATLTRAVATLGTPELEVAAAAAGIPLPVAADAAHSLSAMGILKVGHRLEFRSSITQSAMAQDVSPVERDTIHARAANLLRAMRAAPERIAAHLLETASVEGEWVAATLCAAGGQAIADGSYDLAMACLRRALREPLPDEMRDEVLLNLGIVEVYGHPTDAVEHLAAVRGDREWAQRFGTIARSYAAGIRGESAHRAVELANRARRDLGRATGDAGELRTAAELCYLVLALIFADRLQAARQCCHQFLSGWHSPLVTDMAGALDVMISYRAGDVATAMAAARASLDATAGHGTASWAVAGITLPILIESAIDRDELSTARDAIEHANLSSELPEFWRYHYLLNLRGRWHAATGDVHAALADHLECGRRCEEGGILNPAVVPWRSRAAVLYGRLGRHDQAAELAAQDLTLARRWGAPRALGVALRTAGTVDQSTRGRALLGEAVAVLQESGATLELCRALTELGASLGAAGHRDEAAATLHRARGLAERCGAVRVLGKIDGLLRATPARSRQELTPHELRIATMVVSGRTNREIAAEFRVTSRAVELHLTKLYRKLGISRRSQLATALSCHGY